MRFAAIDFETANNSRDSACAVGITLVEGLRIVDQIYHLIQPPTEEFRFTHVHGLAWKDVCMAPTFGALWPTIARSVGKLDFFAAHNAPFDRSVLLSCCKTYRLPTVDRPFICTVHLARQLWNVHPTKLPDVCRRLKISLAHHQADSDAEACARIVLAAAKAGWTPI